MTIFEKLQQVRSTKENVSTILANSIMDNEREIVYAIQAQLWDGRDGTGKDLTPSYLDDPYFLTRQAAQAYAEWKDKITHNSGRNFYAPNLYINGYFWSTMKIDRNSMRMVSNGFGTPIISKYGENTFTLDPNDKDVVDKIRNSLIGNSKKSLSL